MKTKFLAIFAFVVLFAGMTYAERKDELRIHAKLNFTDAPTCEGRPDFITEVRPQILGGFEKLPKLVLVASESDYYIESKKNGEDVRIHSYQSFREVNGNEKSKIVCGSAKSDGGGRFALFAPTLIDTTVAKNVGQSLWQFQMLKDKRGFSAWNQRSLAFAANESLEKNVLQFGGNYRIYQLSPDQYEVVISKDEGGLVQYLSVRYDVAKNY